MNRFLASTLSTINLLLALAIIVCAMVLGGTYGQAAGQLSGAGLLIGLVCGLIVAATICGLIAFLTLIERHLSFIAEANEYQNTVLKILADRQAAP
ncbi:MAG: hypothetical protein ACK4ZU_02015 [Allorhizobium sp.]